MSSHVQEQVRFRPLGRGVFVGGIVVTLGIHLGLAVLLWFAHSASPPRVDDGKELMVTQTVRFGVVRDKRLLPRKPTEPKSEAPVQEVKVTESAEAPAAPKEPERPKKAEESKDPLKKALDRAKALAAASADPVEGDPLGSPTGTATEASVGDAYATAVMEAIRSNWNVPTGLSIGAVANLEAVIKIVIGPDGQIEDHLMRKSSGNALYDDSCMEAIKATRRVPPPPAAVRAMYRKGVGIVFDGKDMAR